MVIFSFFFMFVISIVPTFPEAQDSASLQTVSAFRHKHKKNRELCSFDSEALESPIIQIKKSPRLHVNISTFFLDDYLKLSRFQNQKRKAKTLLCQYVIISNLFLFVISFKFIFDKCLLGKDIQKYLKQV